MAIYNFPIAKEALLKANTPQNIVGGFNKSGIFPCSPDVLQGHDFAPSFAIHLKKMKMCPQQFL